MRARVELEELVKHLDDAIRAKIPERQTHLSLAGKAWGRAFVGRKELNHSLREAMPIIMRALSVRTLEASTYSLTGLRFIASTMVEKFDTMTDADVDVLRNHADLCGLGFRLGWVDEPLPAYDEGVTPEYLEAARKKQFDEAQEFWKEKEQERKRESWVWEARKKAREEDEKG